MNDQLSDNERLCGNECRRMERLFEGIIPNSLIFPVRELEWEYKKRVVINEEWVLATLNTLE